MKIFCDQNSLQKAGLLAEKLAGRNPALPILNSVLITAKDKFLSFLSTNLEMALEFSVNSKVEKEGRVAIPAKLFSGLISTLPAEEIRIESSNGNLIVITKNSSTVIKGYPQEDFPILPKIKEKKSFVVPAEDFISGLKSVYYAASLSEVKPELNSVYVFSAKNTPLTFVATDSFRLAEKTIPYNFPDLPPFLIPYRSVVEILRVFENIKDGINVIVGENDLVLISEGLRFTTRLIEGVFPDYNQIIPSKFTNTVTVDKRRFLDALRSTSIFCGKLNEVSKRIYKDEPFLELQTKNSELGDHTVKIDSENDGNDLTIMFNYRYLIDCLPFVNSEKILLKFSGDGKPLVVCGLNDSSFRYLAMPMKSF